MKPVNILALLLLSSFVLSVSDVSLPIISLQQTPCYGQCPADIIKIYADGTAVLEGLKYVSLLGTYKTKVSNKFIHNVQCRAFDAGYFFMADTYPQASITIIDAPSVITRLSACNQVKTITETGYAPEALRIFEDWLINELMRLPWAGNVKKSFSESSLHRLNHVIHQ